MHYNDKMHTKYVKHKTFTSFTPKFLYFYLRALFPFMQSSYFQHMYKPAKDIMISYRLFLLLLMLYTVNDMHQLITYDYVQDAFHRRDNPHTKTNRAAVSSVVKLRKMGLIKVEKIKYKTKFHGQTVDIRLTSKGLDLIRAIHAQVLQEIKHITNITGKDLNYTDYSLIPNDDF